MEAPVVWGIDLGTTTGFASRQGETVLAAEARTFPSDDSRFTLFYDFIQRAAWRRAPSWVYYEDVMRHPSATQSKVWGGMRGVLFAALGGANLPTDSIIVPVAVSTLKKFATGSGRADKPMMVEAAVQKIQRGNVRQPTPAAVDIMAALTGKHAHDVADALWLAEYGVKEVG
jgi:Holliday junction resolvasome RuvABC endonuclease subunit